MACLATAAVLLSTGGSGSGTHTAAGAATGRASRLARSAPSRLRSTAGAMAPRGRSGPIGPPAHTPAALRLQHQITRALRGAGARVGWLVQDVTGGSPLAARDASVARPPASVEKLYTTVAALDLLGPDARFDTTVLGRGRLGSGGVWHGDLYLRGGGDPTLGDGGWNQSYEDGHGPTALELATQLRRAGIERVTGHIFADDSLFDTEPGGPATAGKPDTPDYGGEMSALVYDHGMSTATMSPAVFTAHELALTLRGLGVHAGAARRARATPPGAVRLARVQSPPLSVLMRLMDVPSDDLIADMLTKQLGARFLGRGTLAAGARVLARTIAGRYGLHPTIHDGSGLDAADSTSPAEIVRLLREVWGKPTGRLLHAALPVVGRQGTVRGIGVDSPAAGRCVAKTGTLDTVTDLAGYCRARDRRTLAFAVMIVGPTNYQAVPMLSRVVAAIAGYRPAR